MGRKSWRKLWQDALRSSPKWTRLCTGAKGLWLELFLMAQDDGRLELYPGRPLTVADFVYELREKTREVNRWLGQLEGVGLVAKEEGTYRLTGMKELTVSPPPVHLRSTLGSPSVHLGGTSRSSDSNDLGLNSRPYKKRREGAGGKCPPPPARERRFDGHRKGDKWEADGTRYSIDQGGWLCIHPDDGDPYRKEKVL